MPWAEECRAIDEWAADLGLVVDWYREHEGDPPVLYAGNSTFRIDDEVTAVHFRLRFG